MVGRWNFLKWDDLFSEANCQFQGGYTLHSWVDDVFCFFWRCCSSISSVVVGKKKPYPKIFQSPHIQAPNTAEFGPPGRANVPRNGGAVLQHLSPKMVGWLRLRYRFFIHLAKSASPHVWKVATQIFWCKSTGVYNPGVMPLAAYTGIHFTCANRKLLHCNTSLFPTVSLWHCQAVGRKTLRPTFGQKGSQLWTPLGKITKKTNRLLFGRAQRVSLEFST